MDKKEKSQLKQLLKRINNDSKKWNQKEILDELKKKCPSYKSEISKFSQELYEADYRLFKDYYITRDDFTCYLRGIYDRGEGLKLKEKTLLYSAFIKNIEIIEVLQQKKLKPVCKLYIELCLGSEKVAEEICREIVYNSNYKNILFIDYRFKYIVIDFHSEHSANNLRLALTDEFHKIWYPKTNASSDKAISLSVQQEAKFQKYLEEKYGHKDPREYNTKK